MGKQGSVLYDLRKSKNSLLPYEVLGDVLESREQFQSIYQQMNQKKA